MKKKLTLWVSDDEHRILGQSLKLHQQKLVAAITSTDFQRKFIRQELGMTTELLQQVESGQPLVAFPSLIKHSNNQDRDLYNKSFYELQEGNKEAIIACNVLGEQIQVSYDQKDCAFTITVNDEIRIKNQQMSVVLDSFIELVKD